MAPRGRQWQRPDAGSEEDWEKELRARTHDLAEQIGILSGQLAGNARLLGELKEQVNAQLVKDQIAHAVADELHSRRRWWWNLYTKALAGMTGFVVLAASIKGLFGL